MQPARPDRERTGLRSRLAVESLIAAGSRVLCICFEDAEIVRALAAKSCRLVSVGGDAASTSLVSEMCESAIAADLDVRALSHVVPSSRFDVALFGPGFGSLREPGRVVRDAASYLDRASPIVFLLHAEGPGVARPMAESDLSALCMQAGYRIVDWCEVAIESEAASDSEGAQTVHAGTIAVAATENGTQSILPQSGAIRRRLEEMPSSPAQGTLLASLADQNEFLQNRVEDLDRSISEMLASFRESKAALAEEYASRVRSLETQIAESESTLARLAASAENDRSERETLQVRLDAADAEIVAANVRADELRVHLEAARTATATRSAELRIALEAAAASRRDVDGLAAERAELATQLAALTAAIESSRDTAKHAEEARRTLAVRFSATQAELEKARHEIAAFNERERALEERRIDNEAALDFANAEREEISRALARARASLAHANAENAANAARAASAASLEAELNERTAESARLRDRIERLEGDARESERAALAARRPLVATIDFLQRQALDARNHLARSADALAEADISHARLCAIIIEIVDLETERTRSSATKLDAAIARLTNNRLSRLRRKLGVLRRFASALTSKRP